jgi:hypothetical protein
LCRQEKDETYKKMQKKRQNAFHKWHIIGFRKEGGKLFSLFIAKNAADITTHSITSPMFSCIFSLTCISSTNSR